MLKKRKLLVITGLPATGKTTLAKTLSEKLSIPLSTKDQFKICLLQHLGKKDRAWDIKLGIAAVDLQILMANSLLKTKTPVILESNFKQEYDAPKIKALIQSTKCECLQLVCGAEGERLFKRYAKRAALDNSRDLLTQDLDEWKRKLQKGFEGPLELPGDFLSIDTTDFAKVDYEKITKQALKFLEE